MCSFAELLFVIPMYKLFKGNSLFPVIKSYRRYLSPAGFLKKTKMLNKMKQLEI